MARLSYINSHDHALLKIEQSYNIESLLTMSTMMVFPAEIAAVQREYAIIFRKHPDTGRLFPNILLGLAEKENLFIDETGEWQGQYQPLSLQKGPFLITTNPNTEQNNDVLAIDLEDPRVNDSKGEAIFDENNKPTAYLDKVNQVLAQMHADADSIAKMVDAFTELSLIEPLTLNIQLKNEEVLNLGGAYTVAKEKIAALTGEQLNNLNQTGFLSLAFYIADSLANLTTLIDIKNSNV
jgi:hypothetical protein